MDMMGRNCTTKKELKSEFFHNTILTKAKKVSLDTKKNSRKKIKNFPKKFNKHVSKEQASILLNAMQLDNYRNKIIRLD